MAQLMVDVKRGWRQAPPGLLTCAPCLPSRVRSVSGQIEPEADGIGAFHRAYAATYLFANGALLLEQARRGAVMDAVRAPWVLSSAFVTSTVHRGDFLKTMRGGISAC